jgi:uncharacterized phage protein (TIGR01671 family)
MNREYRGKSAENGKWLYGSLLQWNDGHTEICVQISKMEFSKITVKADTVDQFTGMKDGKGNRIFENDIIRDTSEKKNYLVVYASVDAAYYLVESTDYNWVQARERPLGRRNNYYIKVMGNVHDNKNLLEE